MTISRAEYNCLRLMANDLMKAEYFISNLGIETRTDNIAGDEFRPIADILKDIVTVCNNNPTIIDDCVKFLETNPTTSDDSEEFLSKYNLEGICKYDS